MGAECCGQKWSVSDGCVRKWTKSWNIVFRGVRNGNVDAKGRLKLPASVKRSYKEKYKRMDLFVTSLDGKVVKVFPLREWEAVEELLSRRSTGPDQAVDGSVKNKILFRANHYGAEESVDGQGRILVPAVLRKSAGMRGSVRIQWQTNHMLVMNEARYNEAAEANALSESDMLHAANLGL